jgi:hypothetical protein
MEKKEFKEKFPHLAEEIETGKSQIDIEFTVEDEKQVRKYSGYEPTAVDFLRRCKTKEQAEEIIRYLEKREELKKGDADELRKILKTQGLRAFGAPKVFGYYEK